MNSQTIWKLKKKLRPQSQEPPSAFLDSTGNLLTNEKAIQNRALEVYTKWLEGNNMSEDLKDLEETNNKLCETRFKQCKKNVTASWDMEDLMSSLY